MQVCSSTLTSHRPGRTRCHTQSVATLPAAQHDTSSIPYSATHPRDYNPHTPVSPLAPAAMSDVSTNTSSSEPHVGCSAGDEESTGTFCSFRATEGQAEVPQGLIPAVLLRRGAAARVPPSAARRCGPHTQHGRNSGGEGGTAKLTFPGRVTLLHRALEFGTAAVEADARLSPGRCLSRGTPIGSE